ncbi:hypothetical protein FD755_023761, partial [Muntiacus reevesi]
CLSPKKQKTLASPAAWLPPGAGCLIPSQSWRERESAPPPPPGRSALHPRLATRSPWLSRAPVATWRSHNDPSLATTRGSHDCSKDGTDFQLRRTSESVLRVPQSGTLKLSHLREGTYTLQLTVVDTAGQRSSDNVSVTVLPVAFSTGGCSSVCSRYHFFCDDGCCIDITLACDGVEQCPDGSDEAFCQNLSAGREMETHTTLAQPRTPGPGAEAGRSVSPEKSEKSATPKQTPELSTTEKKNHSTFGGPESHMDLEMPGEEGDNRGRDGWMATVGIALLAGLLSPECQTAPTHQLSQPFSL